MMAASLARRKKNGSGVIVMRIRTTLIVLGSASVLLAGCGGSSSSSSTGDNGKVAVSIPFSATIGNQPFACATDYAGVGSPEAVITTRDARFFVHDIRFVTNDNREIPMTLGGDENGAATANQKPGEGIEGIALIDLRDKNSGCQGSDDNDQRYTTVRGTAAIGNESIKALRFTVGVPEKYNHIDAQGTQPQVDPVSGEPIRGTIAVGPLAATGMMGGGMHWSWAMGFVHARIEIDPPAGSDVSTFYVHLGSTGCDGDHATGERTCANGNRPEVEIEGFDPALHTVNLDLLNLFSGNDVTVNTGTAGCMSGADDPDCAPLFERLGLSFTGADPDAEHAAVFYAVERR